APTRTCYIPDSEGKDVAKKAATPKAPKAPTPASELVLLALKKAATNPKANWTASTAAGLFNTKEANHLAAIEECTNADRPLLKQVGKTGVLTAAGFERVAGDLSDAEATGAYERLAGELPEEQVGALAKAAAGRVRLEKRAEFIQEAIRRTPNAAAELTPVLEEAVAAEKAEQEARLEAARKRAEAERVAQTALRRALDLLEERRQNRLDALRREYEIEGGKASQLPEPETPDRPPTPELTALPPLTPRGEEEVSFFRKVARRLVSAWLESVRLGKTEARGFLQVAFSNLHALEPIGQEGEKAAFDGVYHRADTGVSTGAPVTVVRPGWKLLEEDGEYVVEPALVKP
ncbi:MAG: hypothetical protein K2V38_02690, partial [Gemmataceae bacterium]|nr:hypothetical protein [Gemmataceae bacterium]